MVRANYSGQFQSTLTYLKALWKCSGNQAAAELSLPSPRTASAVKTWLTSPRRCLVDRSQKNRVNKTQTSFSRFLTARERANETSKASNDFSCGKYV